MKKSSVFFDIDGTLWNEHMQVPESTTEAIRELRADGNYAFFVQRQKPVEHPQ